MNRSENHSILRIVLTVLWRLALTAAVVAALCVLAGAMVLNLVFNGPSQTARNQLTMTLLESERTCAIPGYFLREDTIAYITGSAAPLPGCNDPALIGVQAQGTAEATTHTGDTYAARIMLLPDSKAVSIVSDAADMRPGTQFILAAPLQNGQHFAGINDQGILLISDDPADLAGMASVQCGPVLLRDGAVNEALFNSATGYAPRAAIGQTADGTLIFITADGWNRDHTGATCQDITNLMLHYGAVNACLLDSGAVCDIQAAEKEG